MTHITDITVLPMEVTSSAEGDTITTTVVVTYSDGTEIIEQKAGYYPYSYNDVGSTDNPPPNY